MPLRELRCTFCGGQLTELVSARDYEGFRRDVASGLYEHGADGGTLKLVPSLPAQTVNSDWPYTFAPYALPLKDGKPQVGVEVHNRAEYLNVLKKYNMVEPVSQTEKATCYEDREPVDDIDEKARGDAEFYQAMLNSPSARRRIIRENIVKRDRAAGAIDVV